MAASAPEGGRTAGAGRRVAKNTVLLSIGQVVLAGSMGLWTIMVARYVGPEAFGVYAYAQAGLTILTVVGSLGLDQLLTRDVAQRPAEGLRYLATFGLLRVALMALVLAGAYLAAGASHYPADRTQIAMLVGANAALMALNTLVAALLNAHEAMGYTVIAQSANYLLTLGLGALAIWLRQPFPVILALSAAASTVQLVLSGGFALRLHGRPAGALRRLVFPTREALGLLWAAVPFTLLQLISTVRTYAPALLLQYLTASDAAVGYFAAAQRVHAVTVIVPDMLLQAAFPAFSGAYAREPERFPGMFERAYRYVMAVTVPLAGGLWVLGPPVLALLYGPRYAPAGATLQVLSLALIGGVGWVMGPAMLAMGRQTAYALIYIATMAGAGLLSLWAIPRYGPAGAAGALVAGKLLQDGIYTVLIFRWLGLRFPAAWAGKTAAASLLATAALAVAATRAHFLLAGATVMPAAYAAALVALRTLSAEDWRYLAQFLPARLRRRLALPEAGAGQEGEG